MDGRTEEVEAWALNEDYFCNEFYAVVGYPPDEIEEIDE
jgi:hypothetical protein